MANMVTFTPLDTVPDLSAYQFAFQVDNGFCAGEIVRATVTQKVEQLNGPSGLGVVVLKCTLARIDGQGVVFLDALGDPQDAVVVHTKTLQTDANVEVNVANEVSAVVSECIGEFCNRLAVHNRIAAMGLPTDPAT